MHKPAPKFSYFEFISDRDAPRLAKRRLAVISGTAWTVLIRTARTDSARAACTLFLFARWTSGKSRRATGPCAGGRVGGGGRPRGRYVGIESDQVPVPVY